MEPNTWRENYKPLNDAYYAGTIKPIEFEKEPEPINYSARREEIVQEEIDIYRIICPIVNINDPSILYTCSQAIIDHENDENEKKPNSLFTIKEDF